MTSLIELETAVAIAPSAIVAFSGGVDSSLVAAAAARALGDRAVAVTAVSPALAAGELDGARTVAAAIGIGHRTITTDELARADYRRNGSDRCYHCKTELYDRLADLGAAEGFAVVYSGANVDDLGDWRPGLAAAAEHAVRHPLIEAGFHKDDVRRWAARLQLPSANKPAMPCLASRLPFGTEVEPALLAQVDAAEQALHALGYRDLRVRHLGATGRVELGADDLSCVTTDAQRGAIIAAVRAAGYAEASIDERPLRSGSFTGLRPLPLVVT